MGTDYGPVLSHKETVDRIRELCKRDGGNFRWKRPDGHETRIYHGPRIFSLNASLQLRHTDPQEVSHFTTRIASDHGDRRYRVLTLHDEPPATPQDKAYERALSELGTVYRFGIANGPEDPGTDAFDCSGLTLWAYEPFVALPHNAEAQRMSAQVWLMDASRAERGDLVFMNFPNTRGIAWPHASHVGLFSKPGYMLDTRSPFGEPVAIRAIDYSHVVGFGRVKVS
jgi:cell wall-associated NlpC family hydrolase